LSIIQVNGGSQSFNALNSLRILGRWMRMFVIPNQSSLPMAWKQFEDEGGDGSGDKRLLPSGNRERLVDCMEEFVKFTLMMRGKEELFADRFSERREREAKAKKLAAAEAVVAASKDNESKT
jgi:arsenic resistance protein ArsH